MWIVADLGVEKLNVDTQDGNYEWEKFNFCCPRILCSLGMQRVFWQYKRRQRDIVKGGKRKAALEGL